MRESILEYIMYEQVRRKHVLGEDMQREQCGCACVWPYTAPEASSRTAVAALGRHQAGQQVQGAAALAPDAGQYIAVGMNQARLQSGTPVLVAIAAVGRYLDAA